MSKGFHFRLQTLLNLREAAKEHAEESYSIAIKRRKLAEQDRDSCKIAIQALGQAVLNTRSTHFGAATQPSFLKTLAFSHELLLQKEEQILLAQKEEERLRQIFLKRKQELEILEKLREKHFQAFKKNFQKQEDQQTEDNVSARFARNRQ